MLDSNIAEEKIEGLTPQYLGQIIKTKKIILFHYYCSTLKKRSGFSIVGILLSKTLLRFWRWNSSITFSN